jgi:UPF0755 protein
MTNDIMKASKQYKKLPFYGLFLPVFFIFCTWQSWQWWSWVITPPLQDNPAIADTDETIQINIPSGTATQEIGVDLEETGVIRSAIAWNLWALWLEFKDSQGGFKAGTYQLSLRDNLPTIAIKIWKGEVKQTSFTIPEGWSIKQMANYFESLGYFSASEFIAATRKIPQTEYAWLPDGLPHLEGFLYPDTYRISSDIITPQIIIQMMLNRFEQVALPLYQQAPNLTRFNVKQWVILASIVEKEAVVNSERRRIAGVFVERLRRRMKLETDPTVEYALGIRQTADKPLTLAQIKTPSPYNTYVNLGLPPTPIASPGSASLKATLEAEKTEYLYFVARYDGTHVFSKTLQQHQAATKAIRQKRQAK